MQDQLTNSDPMGLPWKTARRREPGPERRACPATPRCQLPWNCLTPTNKRQYLQCNGRCTKGDAQCHNYWAGASAWTGI